MSERTVPPRPARDHVPSGRARWVVWAVLGIVLVVALAIGASRPARAQNAAQRAAAIDASLRCPSCESVSVADSSASTAVAIREAVATRVRAGESNSRIIAFLEARYGEGILLKPPASGGTALVWVVPLCVGAVAFAGLGALFWRRRSPAVVTVAPEDRTLVDEAMKSVSLEIGS